MTFTKLPTWGWQVKNRAVDFAAGSNAPHEEHSGVTDQLDEPLTQIVDIDKPSAARLYDFLLAGGYNFETDRVLARKLVQAMPNAPKMARLNREFLRRAVSFMVGDGIRQFLDLGSGIPTVGNVHEVAKAIAPDCRVVYVDRDEVAVAHAQLILENEPYVDVVRADLTRPDEVLDAPPVHQLLDFDQPVGMLLVAVLHFVFPEQDPAGAIRRYRDVLAPGSLLAVSHVTGDLVPPDEMAATVDVMKRSRDPIYPRTRTEIVDLFDGFDLLEPGAVPTALWRPEMAVDPTLDPADAGLLAGVGRVPH